MFAILLRALLTIVLILLIIALAPYAWRTVSGAFSTPENTPTATAVPQATLVASDPPPAEEATSDETGSTTVAPPPPPEPTATWTPTPLPTPTPTPTPTLIPTPTPTSTLPPPPPETCAAMVGDPASLIGGRPEFWTSPDWPWGAWVYEGPPTLLRYPGFGHFDDWKQGDNVHADVTTENASFACQDQHSDDA